MKSIMKIFNYIAPVVISYPVDQLAVQVDQYIDYLNQLPAEEFTNKVNQMSNDFKQQFGKSFDELDQMSDNELDKFVQAVQSGQ